MRTGLLGIAPTGGYSNCVIAGVHASGGVHPLDRPHHCRARRRGRGRTMARLTGQDLIRKPRALPARTHTAPAAELATVADALDHIDPWAIDYEQWIACWRR